LGSVLATMLGNVLATYVGKRIGYDAWKRTRCDCLETRRFMALCKVVGC